MTAPRVVPAAARHRAEWEALYAAYAGFYRVTQTPEMRETVWGWIQDPAHEVKALVAEDALLGELRRIARAQGAGVVRWITADDNHRARAAYDRVATRTWWVTYDMAP